MLATLALVLKLTVSPLVSFPPAQLNVTVSVEPQEDNRLCQVELFDQDGMRVRYSEIQLDGEHSRKTYVLVPWKGVGGGTYTARATLVDKYNRVVKQEVQTVIVKEMNEQAARGH